MARNRRVVRLITAYAKKYGVDPKAALAVAMTEGGLDFGAVGDAGSSYGPFQLHRGGALPRGRGADWANSPAGIEYALRSMSRAGARGKTGRAAVQAIVTNFERPANIPGQISKAWDYYGDVAPQMGPTGPGPGAPAPAAPGGFDRNAMAQALIDAPFWKPLDPMTLIGLKKSAPPAEAEPAAAPTTDDEITGAGGGSWGGSLAVANEGKKIAAEFGLRASGKRSTKNTSSGGISDHWVGSKNAFAYDLSGSRAQMHKAAKALAKALGLRWNGKTELIENVYVGPYRVQIIYNTPKYGGHMDHIHFGVRLNG